LSEVISNTPQLQKVDWKPIAENKVEKKEERRNAQEEAYRQGFAAGYKQAQAELEEVVKGQVELIRDMLGQLEGLRNSVESAGVEWIKRLALLASARILRQKLEEDDRLIQRVLEEVVREFKVEGKVKIRLNPIDAKFLGKYLGQLPKGKLDAELLEDENIMKGGCVVEGDFGIFDARIPTSFAKVYETLMGVEDDGGAQKSGGED